MNEVTKMEPQSQEVAAHREADPMLSMIERVIMSPEIPVDRITALMDIRERQIEKAAEQDFNAAFAAAMAEMPDVPKSGENKHTKRKYPTLDDLVRTARPVLARHGLSLNWKIGIDGDRIAVSAIVRHAGGHMIETTDHAQRDKSGAMNAIQGGGSAQTYLKRYTGFAILGLSAGDEVEDDGQSAAPRPEQRQQQNPGPSAGERASDQMITAIRKHGVENVTADPNFQRDLERLKSDAPEMAARVQSEIETQRSAKGGNTADLGSGPIPY